MGRDATRCDGSVGAGALRLRSIEHREGGDPEATSEKNARPAQVREHRAETRDLSRATTNSSSGSTLRNGTVQRSDIVINLLDENHEPIVAGACAMLFRANIPARN